MNFFKKKLENSTFSNLILNYKSIRKHQKIVENMRISK